MVHVEVGGFWSCDHLLLPGLDTNIPKNALKIYPEILIFSLNMPPKISKYPQKFLKIPKYPKIKKKFLLFSKLFFTKTLVLPWKENRKHILDAR